MDRKNENLCWYALHVRNRLEKVVARNLQAKGYEEFLPLRASRRRWSDRTKLIELPLFPGYVFCKFNLEHRLPILMVPGVYAVVGIGRGAAQVEEQEIQNIRTIVNSGFECEPCAFFQAGDVVTIDAGAFEGVKGIVVNSMKGRRLIVSIQILQRSVAVEIDGHSIRRARKVMECVTMPTTPLSAMIRKEHITGDSNAGELRRL